MRDPVVSLADIDRLAGYAPTMSAHQMSKMLRWIAEIRNDAEQRINLYSPDVPVWKPEAWVMGPTAQGRVMSVPDPLASPTTPAGEPVVASMPEEIDFKALVDGVFKDLEQSPCKEPAPATAPDAQHEPEPETRSEPVQVPDETAPVSGPVNTAPGPEPKPAGEWSEDEIQTALLMQEGGSAAKAIAKALNRPLGGTQFMLHKLRSGWRPRSRSQRAKPAVTPAPAAAKPITPATPPITVQPKVTPVPMPSQAGPLTGAQRTLMARIMRTDDDFTPADDLYLCEQIIARTGLDLIADQLGCDAATVKARWHALLGFDPKTVKGGIPLDLQADLLTVLRQLAGKVAA